MIQKEQIRINENGAIRAEGHTVFRWFWSEQLHGVVVHPNAVAVLQIRITATRQYAFRGYVSTERPERQRCEPYRSDSRPEPLKYTDASVG